MLKNFISIDGELSLKTIFLYALRPLDWAKLFVFTISLNYIKPCIKKLRERG